jgi:riboflavin synthase
MQMNARLDGHIVQGHVDQTATCTNFTELDGSWEYTFEYDAAVGNVTVEKGSICVNGISLTVVNSGPNYFSVAIIPYTYEHTNLHNVSIGTQVNLEFDIIGKYVARLMHR